MAKKERFVRYTTDELAKMESKTDWAKVDAMTEAEIEQHAIEDGLPPEGWEATVFAGLPEPRKDVHIRLEQSVLRWFKAPGPGYQTRINAVLRAFVQERERDKRRTG